MAPGVIRSGRRLNWLRLGKPTCLEHQHFSELNTSELVLASFGETAPRTRIGFVRGSHPSGTSTLFGNQHVITGQWVRLVKPIRGRGPPFMRPILPSLPTGSFRKTVIGFVRGKPLAQSIDTFRNSTHHNGPMGSFGQTDSRETSPVCATHSPELANGFVWENGHWLRSGKAHSPGSLTFFGTQHIRTGIGFVRGSRFEGDFAGFLDSSSRECHWLRLETCHVGWSEAQPTIPMFSMVGCAPLHPPYKSSQPRNLCRHWLRSGKRPAQGVCLNELSKNGGRDAPHIIIGRGRARVPGIHRRRLASPLSVASFPLGHDRVLQRPDAADRGADDVAGLEVRAGRRADA
jgi:hypothetical protein